MLAKLFSGPDPKAQAVDLMASLIRVEGMFNVNSTSVEAWRSLLSSLFGEDIMTRNEEGRLTRTPVEDVPVASTFAPRDLEAKGQGLVPTRDPNQWVGRRSLSDAEITELAEAIVREVRKRGPFLSLADFVNRRVDSDPDLARASAIQNALDSEEVTVNEAYNVGDRAVEAGLAKRLTFPEAEEGAAAELDGMGPHPRGRPPHPGLRDAPLHRPGFDLPGREPGPPPRVGGAAGRRPHRRPRRGDRQGRRDRGRCDEIAYAVRTLALRRRIVGPQIEGAADDQALLDLLKDARERLDPLSWRVRLVEAELLLERHDYGGAGAAAQEAHALCPRGAGPARLIARLQIAGFNLDAADAIADLIEAGAASVEDDAASIDAALIRARADLRRDHAGRAAETVNTVLESAPRCHDALALHAAALAAGFKDAAAERALDAFDAVSPGHPLALYEAGAALSEQRQYDLARQRLTQASARRPTWSQPLIDLGLLEIQTGRDAAARDAFERALKLDAFNDRARNSLALVDGLAPWPIIEGDHFRVRYRPGPDAVLAREMLPVLDAIHRRVTGDPELVPGGIGHEPTEKTLLELMPGHRWFSVRITGMTRVHTMAAATGPVIAMESPREGPGFKVGPFDWPRVIQHEYAHTVTLSRTRNRIPHWFTEAAAVYLEDAPRPHHTWMLLLRAFETGTLFDLDKVNVAFVRPKKPTDRSQAYAQGHWMYEFILERWGPLVPLRLMDRYAAGQAENEAFEDELAISREAFMSEFLIWAEAQLRTHRLLPDEGVPTLAALVETYLNENNGAEVTADVLRAWLDEHPGHPQVVGALVEHALDALGEPDERPARLPENAVELLTEAARLRPTDDQPRRLLARHHLAADDAANRELAIEHLEFLDVRETNSPSFAIELANLYAAAGELDLAHAKALRAVRISPFDADYRELAARVAILAGDWRAGEHQIEALTEIEPDQAIHRRRLEAIRAKIAELEEPAPPQPETLPEL